MSGIHHLERKYHCYNDCRPEGCSGHIATLDYESVSDYFTFKDGKGNGFSSGPPEIEVFIEMIKEIDQGIKI